MHRYVRSFVALCLASSLAAAACGGDTDDGTTTLQTVDEDVQAGINAAMSGGGSEGNAAPASKTTPTSTPTSFEEWEALAATQRAAIVQKIEDNGWGRSADGTTLLGPDGFTVDLAACPAGWSDTEGVSDTEIKIGHTTALSGPVADFGNAAKAMEVIYRYYSDQGVFVGPTPGTTRQVRLVVRDDAYDPARTIPLIDELIDSERVFAAITLGSPTTLRVYDKLNERCILHPLVPTGHPAWGDPENHPWTTGLQLAYTTEAVLWGSFIENRLAEFPDGKVKVAAMLTTNDFGKAYDSAFRAYIEQSPNKDKFEYFTESAEVSEPTITAQMTTLASKQPDVLIFAGPQCTPGIIEAAQNGMQQDVTYRIISQNCKASSNVSKEKVGGDGSASDGWWIFSGGIRDINSPSEDDNPYIAWARELLRSAGIDPKGSGYYGHGFEYAFPLIQAIRIAGELPGGITRSNVLLALRTMDMTHPMLLDGIKFNMSGNKDAFFIEGSEIARYDSASQEWVVQGDVIDLSGKSQNCAFSQATQTCA